MLSLRQTSDGQSLSAREDARQLGSAFTLEVPPFAGLVGRGEDTYYGTLAANPLVKALAETSGENLGGRPNPAIGGRLKTGHFR